MNRQVHTNQELHSAGSAAARCVQSTGLPGQKKWSDGENAVKGIASDKKAGGAKLINFYFPRLVEGDCLLFREARKALGPDFVLPLICSSFSTVTRTLSDSQQTIGTEIRTQHLVLCIPNLQREQE